MQPLFSIPNPTRKLPDLRIVSDRSSAKYHGFCKNSAGEKRIRKSIIFASSFTRNRTVRCLSSRMVIQFLIFFHHFQPTSRPKMEQATFSRFARFQPVPAARPGECRAPSVVRTTCTARPAPKSRLGWTSGIIGNHHLIGSRRL